MKPHTQPINFLLALLWLLERASTGHLCAKVDLRANDSSAWSVSSERHRPPQNNSRRRMLEASRRDRKRLQTKNSKRWNSERDASEACTCEAIARIETAGAYESARALRSRSATVCWARTRKLPRPSLLFLLFSRVHAHAMTCTCHVKYKSVI